MTEMAEKLHATFRAVRQSKVMEWDFACTGVETFDHCTRSSERIPLSQGFRRYGICAVAMLLCTSLAPRRWGPCNKEGLKLTLRFYV